MPDVASVRKKLLRDLGQPRMDNIWRKQVSKSPIVVVFFLLLRCGNRVSLLLKYWMFYVICNVKNRFRKIRCVVLLDLDMMVNDAKMNLFLIINYLDFVSLFFFTFGFHNIDFK